MKKSVAVTVSGLLAGSTLLFSAAVSGATAEFINNPALGNSGAAPFTFTEAGGFYGTFEYNGVTYGVNAAAIDLNSLPNNTDLYVVGEYDIGNLDYNNSAFRIYKRQYSAVIGNNAIQAIQNGDSDREFVRAVVGRATTTREFAALGNQTLTYSGEVFNHITTSGNGSLTYTIDTATRTGSGSFAGLTGNQPQFGSFILDGTLETAALTAIGRGRGSQLRIIDGGVSLTSNNEKLNEQLANYDPKYDLGVYGPNAEEIAGHIHDLSEPSQQNILGGIGFSAAR
ncbi:MULTISPECIES: factor H binding protein domain-containing protein [Brenneria]|uniref:Factor H binding protein-like C-terminal domain-containing protein n=1 Tax=Brenneria nigrifluens DSM 30175 = ATCC 13028 TaxID=1121120 RepID=A0A2U1UQT5_9GAMM|nr:MULTISPECIES: factor H binding protein domain-containing protein [Brenneria]EHD22204.1 hypothetical protein BrE312_2831 [Brenneria sp. EniD312]PWC24036.1 hypothetical protein DDT54_10775 [Brenneria nigrifluens DSM 30175 = ATCC 13028]QCR05229.1 hypothetical protein EH206_14170 [Brenneria nigrifluens DSM 30175 = ATCC 13028]